jgi:hypothetical protein
MSVRTVTGHVMVGAAVFSAVLGGLLAFDIAPGLKVLPTHEWIHTVARATDASYLDETNGQEVTGATVVNTTSVAGDPSQAGAPSGSVLWQSKGAVMAFAPAPCGATGVDVATSGCPLNFISETVALDKHTGLGVQWKGNALSDLTTQSASDPSTPVDYAGAVVWKFPFNTKKTTYQYYDPALGYATPMHYTATTSLNGRTVYEFVQTIAPTKIFTTMVPNAYVGSSVPGSTFAPITYADVRTVWVEPTSGIPVKETDAVDQEIANPANPTVGVTPTLKGDFTIDQLQATNSKGGAEYNADGSPRLVDYTAGQFTVADRANQVVLLEQTLPIVFGSLAVVLAAGGAYLSLTGRRPEDEGGSESTSEELAEV